MRSPEERQNILRKIARDKCDRIGHRASLETPNVCVKCGAHRDEWTQT